MPHYHARRRAPTGGSGSWYPPLVKGAGETPTLSVPLNAPGVDNLDPVITINSQTVAPAFRYRGGDASASGWPAWGYGDDLTYVAPGAAPTFNNGSLYWGTSDDAVKFNSGNYYQAPSSTLGNIAEEDFVFEALVNVRNNTSEEIFSKFISGTFWVIDKIASGSNYYFLFQFDGASGTAGVSTGVFSDPGWHHIMIFYDKSGSLQVYVDGVGNGTAVVSGVGSLSGSAIMTIGARTGGASPTSVDVAYCAMWIQDNWLSSHINTTFYQERLRKLIGIQAEAAVGSKDPSQWTRASGATLDVHDATAGTRRIHYVPTGWMRICKRPNMTGYLSEIQTTNLATDSEDMSAWTATNVTVTTDQFDAPDDLTSMDLLTDDATLGLHRVHKSITMTGTTPTVFSCFAKKGTADYVWLGADVNGVQRYSFNLDTGALDTQISGTPNAGIEDWGNGIYRCWIRATPSGSGAYNFSIGISTNGTSDTYSGSGDTIYAWGAQCEQTAGVDSPTTYIHTRGGSTVTRSGDKLRYNPTGGNAGDLSNNFEGTFRFDIAYPDEVVGTATKMAFAFADTTVSNNFLYISTDTTDVIERYVISSESSAENQASSVNMSDGVKKSIKMTCRSADTKLYVDNVLAIDGSVGIVNDNANIMEIGVWTTGALQFNGLFSNFKVYKGIV